MIFPSAPALFLFMSMLIDCPPVPVPEDEKYQIIAAAYHARSAELAKTEFESVSVTKCIMHYELREPEHGHGRTENINLSGLFPHTIQTDLYRERHSIRCHKSTDYRDNSVIDHRDSCTEELERYMQYDGLSREVSLRGSVAIEDAVAYLDYLMQYDFGDRNQSQVVDEMLQQIQWVELDRVRNQQRFRASFNPGGCATIIFEATVERDQSLVFGKVDLDMRIC